MINSLLAAGLVLAIFYEYPFSPYDCFDNLQEGQPGKFYPISEQEVPMLYSLRARSGSFSQA